MDKLSPCLLGPHCSKGRKTGKQQLEYCILGSREKGRRGVEVGEKMLAPLEEVEKASLEFWHLNWFLKDGQ